MVYCPCSLVSNQIYHPTTSFPMKYTIESMVYCSQLPNMVRARWLWRRSWEPIRKGEIFWMNNNWACYLLLDKAFYCFLLVLANNLFHLICLCKQFFQFFLNPLSKSWWSFIMLDPRTTTELKSCFCRTHLNLALWRHDIWTERQLQKYSWTATAPLFSLWTFKLRTVRLKWN